MVTEYLEKCLITEHKIGCTQEDSLFKVCLLQNGT